jgi:PAS domain S-box-containing protein
VAVLTTMMIPIVLLGRSFGVLVAIGSSLAFFGFNLVVMGGRLGDRGLLMMWSPGALVGTTASLLVGILAGKAKETLGKLEQEVALRVAAENKANDAQTTLESKMKELELENQEHTQTRVAMVNLLEDARELEEELKQEKQGVEQKVKERTKELREKTEALEVAQQKVSEGWLSMQREKARLTASINSLWLGFVMTDLENNVLYANQAMERILGVPVYELTMQVLEEKLGGVFAVATRCKDCVEEDKEIEESEVRVGDKDVRILLAPIELTEEEKSVIGVVMLFEDISEAKAVQRSRDEFFAVASHELRTPLTAIRGNTSMMQEFFAAEIQSPDFREMLTDVHKASVRLINIVNDFLDASRLELNKLDLKIEVFNLIELLEEGARELFGPAETAMHLIREYDTDSVLPVKADRERVRQILVNLLGNAKKFAKVGEVKVYVESDEVRARVKVIDTGPGIREEDKQKLFTKFKQLKSAYTRDVTQGTGMGLYVSRLLAEAMGGRTYLEWSEPGKGSVFVVELPLG